MAGNSLARAVEVALQIAERQHKLEDELREALDAEQDELALRLARKLVGPKKENT